MNARFAWRWRVTRLLTEDGMLVFLHITATGNHAALTGITYLPTWDRHPDYAVLPIGEAFQDHQAPVGVLTKSYNRTTGTVGRIPGALGPIPGRLRAAAR